MGNKTETKIILHCTVTTYAGFPLEHVVNRLAVFPTLRASAGHEIVVTRIALEGDSRVG